MSWNIFRSSEDSLRDLLDEESLVKKIAQAESQTSGEIKLFIENHNPMVEVLDRAEEIFADLKMENTKYRNAVLIYMAYKDKEYAIFGDTGIFEKHSQEEWNELAREVRNHIYTKGLQNALEYSIISVGQWLSQEFPPDPDDDKNELPDEIVFGS